MATSRSLLFSVLLSGLVFSAAAVPLAILGSRPITVEVEEKPLLTGRLQDLASPYLSFALCLSAGAGLVALSMSEWRNTSRKLNQMRDRVSQLEQQLQQQEHQVERLKFSESRLQSQGLNFFIDPADVPAASGFAPVQKAPAADLQHAISHQSIPHHASSQNSGSQSGLQSGSQTQAGPQLEELVVAMKQLMSQVEQLKNAETGHAGVHPINPSINPINASVRA